MRRRGGAPRPSRIRSTLAVSDRHRLACIAAKKCEICGKPGEIIEYDDLPELYRRRCRCSEHREA